MLYNQNSKDKNINVKLFPKQFFLSELTEAKIKQNKNKNKPNLSMRSKSKRISSILHLAIF